MECETQDKEGLEELHHSDDGAIERPIHWSDSLGAHYTRKPDLQMLKPDGMKLLRFASCKGESKRRDERKRSRWFLYDRSFVIHHIAYWLSPLLLDMPRAELLKLLTEAKAIAKDERERFLSVSANRQN